jgi:hypothetical protein
MWVLLWRWQLYRQEHLNVPFACRESRCEITGLRALYVISTYALKFGLGRWTNRRYSPCLGKPGNGIEQCQRVYTSDTMVDYRSRCHSIWIGHKRCRVDVKLVGSCSCICLRRPGILSRLCTCVRPGRFRCSLCCTIGWLHRRLVSVVRYET